MHHSFAVEQIVVLPVVARVMERFDVLDQFDRQFLQEPGTKRHYGLFCTAE